jgi:hypothetical protein
MVRPASRRTASVGRRARAASRVDEKKRIGGSGSGARVPAIVVIEPPALNLGFPSRLVDPPPMRSIRFPSQGMQRALRARSADPASAMLGS